MSDPRALSTFVANHPHARELTTLNESGLITVDQGRALAQATTQWNALKAVSGTTKDGRPAPRHFNKVDRLLSVRLPSATSQARDLLSSIGTAWDELSGDFHRFREMYLEAKLKRAELNKRARLITEQIGKGELESDDVAIQEASIQLDGARIDKLEAEVHRGQAALKAGLTIMSERSTRYQNLLTSSGKTEFTTADFEAEEMEYLLRSAWMVASQAYGASPIPSANGGTEIYRRINLPHEIELYFQNLGVTVDELKTEFRSLQLQRESYDLAKHPGSETNFSSQFDNWIIRMAAKYKARIIAAVKTHGIDRLKAIQEIIDPPSDTGSHGKKTQIDRRSVLS